MELTQRNRIALSSEYSPCKVAATGSIYQLKLLLLVLLVWSTTLEVGNADPLCMPFNGTNSLAMPKLQGSYEARMEWWEEDYQSMVYREDYVDQEHNMAAVRVYGMYDPGDVYTYISDYSTRQFYTLTNTEKGAQCTVSSISKDEEFTFPFVNNASIEHMLPTSVLLNFDTTSNEEYKGQDKVRGKQVDHLSRCSQDADGNLMKVDYYFSAAHWSTSASTDPVPLRSEVSREIKSRFESKPYIYKRQIDFVFFQMSLKDRTIFKLPDGVFCKGRLSSKPVPEIPVHFKFRSERLVTQFKEYGEYDEWYNQEAGLVRLDSNPISGDVTLPSSSATQTIVLDFHTGLSFDITKDSGSCNVTPIKADMFVTKRDNSDHLRLSSPKEFFRFDSGNFVWSGVVTERDIPADTWIGQRSDYPSGSNETSIWTWYFSTGRWKTLQNRNDQSSSSISIVPLKLKIQMTQSEVELIFNIYSFEARTPDLSDFDVSACFVTGQTKRRVELTLRGDTSTASLLPFAFKHQISLTLRDVLGISILRMLKLQTDIYQGFVNIRFDLVEPPNVKGDVIETGSASWNSSVSAVILKLKTFLQSTTTFFHFRFSLGPGQEKAVIFIGLPESLRVTALYKNGTEILETVSGGVTSPVTPTTRQTSLSAAKGSESPTPSLSSSIVTSLFSSTPGACSCEADKQRDNESKVWSTSTVIGLCVGLAMAGIVLGILGTIVMYGRVKEMMRSRGEASVPLQNL